MGHVAGTAAAVMGTVTILGGASMGAVIDIAYNGTIIPLATASLIGFTTAFAFFIWADRVWDEATQPVTDPAQTADR
jgi:DHA1 family bicyclomycin/chloramphenicol resistance-like MFS transporter